MQDADRKLAWSAVFVLAVIALEIAIALAVIGPEYKEAHSAAARAAEAQGYRDYSMWEYSGTWIAVFTIVLTLSTIALWWTTRRSVRVSERALTDLERPYMFVYELSDLHANMEIEWPVVTYSVGNYGKAAAIIETVSEGMWMGSAYDTDKLEPGLEGHPILKTRLFSPNFAKEKIEVMGPEGLEIEGHNLASLGVRLYVDGPDFFFRVLITYRGPFTAGHSTSACWRFDAGEGVFALMLDDRVTYSR